MIEYSITVYPQKEVMPYDESKPYGWIIESWCENDCKWKYVNEGNAETPEQAFQDAMELHKKLIK